MRGRRAGAVLFDLDGTLLDTQEDLALSLNFVLARFGRTARTPAEVRSFIGDGVRELLKRGLGPEGEKDLEAAVALFLEHYGAHCADHAALYPGARETLRALAGTPLAVVTNKWAAASNTLLKASGIDGFFQTVLGGDSLPVRKPSPEPLLEAARRLGARPADCLMVGDSPGDVEAGKAAGMATCAVTFGYRSEEELKRAGPDFIAAGLKDVLKIVEG